MDVPLTWYNLGVLSWVTCCNPEATPPSKIRIPSYAKKKEIDQSRASFLLKSSPVKKRCTKSKKTPKSGVQCYAANFAGSKYRK